MHRPGLPKRQLHPLHLHGSSRGRSARLTLASSGVGRWPRSMVIPAAMKKPVHSVTMDDSVIVAAKRMRDAGIGFFLCSITRAASLERSRSARSPALCGRPAFTLDAGFRDHGTVGADVLCSTGSIRGAENLARAACSSGRLPGRRGTARWCAHALGHRATREWAPARQDRSRGASAS
jgi:hypothetical protein